MLYNDRSGFNRFSSRWMFYLIKSKEIRMYKKLLVGMTVISAAIAVTQAQAVQFEKPIKTNVIVTKPDGAGTKKQVMVLNIKLSQKERNLLLNYKPKNFKTRDLPSSANVGMNNVPVLDQGMHGTCVTFATTAAMDAILGKGDYISQLCNLELGSYLETLGYMPSGWDGSWGAWVFDQMVRFGVVSKDIQTSKGCAGVMDYPVDNWTNEGNPMTLNEFNKNSIDVSSTAYTVEYLNLFKRFDNKFQDSSSAWTALQNVKQSIANSHRVLIGTFLVLSPYCSAGACAKHNAAQDTWALTSEISTPPYFMGGHEMVIYGYDDNATATDAAGNTYTGLLTLRNSWGSNVGDNGDYYMTYDYFMKFAGDVQELVPMASDK